MENPQNNQRTSSMKKYIVLISVILFAQIVITMIVSKFLVNNAMESMNDKISAVKSDYQNDLKNYAMKFQYKLKEESLKQREVIQSLENSFENTMRVYNSDYIKDLKEKFKNGELDSLNKDPNVKRANDMYERFMDRMELNNYN